MRRLAALAACMTLAFAIAPAASAAGSLRSPDTGSSKIRSDLAHQMNEHPNGLLDVIVSFSGGSSQAQAHAAEAAIGEFDTGYAYKTIPAVSARMSAGQIRALAARPETASLQPNLHMTFPMASARAAFGSDKAQADFTVDGNNEAGSCPAARTYCADDTVVAVLDTGVDQNHVDLDGGKVLAARECSDGNCYSLANFSGDHGTHVASIIAGEGDGNYANRGVAPGAALVSVKVGTQYGADEAGVDAGIEWVLANRATYGIDLVNMSITSAPPTDGNDVTSRLTNELATAGLTPFVAAGNAGPAAMTVGSPGGAKYATTVGAMGEPAASDWETPLGFDLASWSSRGPTSDGRVKPDIVAPGVDITAATAGLAENGYSRTGYATHSGTSMSAPFAAGVAALMLDANPSLVSSGTACPTGDTSADCVDGVYDATMSLPLRNAMTGTAVDWGPQGPDNEYGYGRLDAYAAVDAASALVGSGGPPVPTHAFVQGSLAAAGDVATYVIPVTGTNYPVSVTFEQPSWSDPVATNFDIALIDPSGAQVATSFYKDKRQETVGFQPTVAGDYVLRVTSVAGSGPFWFDESFSGGGQPPPPPPPSPPATPTGVTATAASSSQINLAWSDVSTETGYRVSRAPASTGPWTDIATLGSNVTSYQNTGLSSGTYYYYRIVAFNTSGSSAPSSVVSARTTVVDTVAPSVPTGVKATGSKGKISLTWTASKDNTGGSGLAGYKVFRSTSATGTFVQVATTAALKWDDTAVTKGVSMYYYVVAYDVAGNTSAKSTTVTCKST